MSPQAAGSTQPERAPRGSGHAPADAARKTPRRDRRQRVLLLVVLGLAAIGLFSVVLGGCREDVATVYGQRRGESWSSVNGTGVLGEMFQQAGHTVFSWRMLSPRLRRRADCIVWFPDDFHVPSGNVCQWLEGWLREAPGRTLVYVGRDFDAALWYWENIRPDAPAADGQKKEIARRRTEAKKHFIRNLRTITTAEECGWFTVKGGRNHRKVRSLEGHPEWLDGVDPAKLEIELNHRLVPPRGSEVLLESEGDLLAGAQRFGQSRLIVVANGSFLLNLPLVNHEHRKLAGQLIAEIGPAGQTVVFLESGPGGPILLDSDPASKPPSGLEIFRVWPANWILLHLAAVGILFCFSRFPIFGRPRELGSEGTTDFGRHIEALGELLQRSGDAAHAAARLAHYRQLTRPDSAPRSETAPKSARRKETANRKTFRART